MSNASDLVMSSAEKRRKAGHQEILGETLAKFEFFQHGWHPYTRFLDVDKIDLLLRRRNGAKVEYREIQVKYGKLHKCKARWEVPLFDVTSWRFFSERGVASLADRERLFLAYVLAPDDGFKGDLFVFPIRTFAELIRQSDRLSNGDYRVYFSRSLESPSRWYLRKEKQFSKLSESAVIDITRHYRDFGCLSCE